MVQVSLTREEVVVLTWAAQTVKTKVASDDPNWHTLSRVINKLNRAIKA